MTNNNRERVAMRDMANENGELLQGCTFDLTNIKQPLTPADQHMVGELCNDVFKSMHDEYLHFLSEDGEPFQVKGPFRMQFGLFGGRKISLSFLYEDGSEVIPTHHADYGDLRKALDEYLAFLAPGPNGEGFTYDRQRAQAANHDVAAARVLDAFKVDKRCTPSSIVERVLPTINYEHAGINIHTRRFHPAGTMMSRKFFDLAFFLLPRVDNHTAMQIRKVSQQPDNW